MKIYAKHILLPDGWATDRLVTVEGDTITAITDGAVDTADHTAETLTYGLFDLHNHGGEGFDSTSLSFELLEKFLLKLRACGTTDILLTLLTSDAALMAAELDFLRQAMARQSEGKLGGARIVGVHMEGPFLNPAKSGAQETSQILAPSVEAFERNFGAYTDIITLVTVAPECDGASELAAHLTKKGIMVQAGHTACDCERAESAFASGFTSVCHTFNACPPIHHRTPGLLTAALTDPAVYCEAICDLVHLHPAIVKLIYHCKGAERMVVISDSTMPTNLPDGRYFYANQWAKVENGVKSTLDGALNGGICYLDGAVKNLVSLGIPSEDAVKMCTSTPAARMGLDTLGSIRLGAPAHLVAWDDAWNPVRTWIGEE